MRGELIMFRFRSSAIVVVVMALMIAMAIDVEGFVVPSEVLNLSFFAPDVVYRFEIENTGDAVPDRKIDITFSPQTARNQPQTATIKLRRIEREGDEEEGDEEDGNSKLVFTAPTTVQTLNGSANAFVVTNDPASGSSFFAGLTDDPFYFDIVGFNRFVLSWQVRPTPLPCSAVAIASPATTST